MMSHRILPAALLLCTVAACSDLPTQNDAQAQPAGPAYDGGGFTIGSGNSGAAGGYSTGTGSSGEEGDDATTALTGETTERQGYTMGSGN
jgi:hypothetical protein